MKVELDGILLNDTQEQADGGILEGRSISSISASDGRNMVMLSVPGMEGSVFQDLGRTAVRLSFEGVISGRNARSVVEMIRSKFKQGEPLGFNSDVSGAADITKVIIEDFRVVDAAGSKDRYSYSLMLKEYIEPPPQPSQPAAQDEEAEAWADNAAEEAEESINVVSGKVLDAEGKPKGGVTVKVTGPDGEYTLTTGDDGVYQTDSLSPGEYETTVDSEGYEYIKHKVVIGEKEAPPPEEEPEEPQNEAPGDIPPPGEKAEEPEAEPIKAAPEKPKKKSKRSQDR